MEDRNKSYWYIERIVTYVRFKDGCVTKPIYERRVDKDPEKVEIGDRVVLFVAPDIMKGVVRNTVLYYDGYFEAVVDVDGLLLYSTQPRTELEFYREEVKNEN